MQYVIQATALRNAVEVASKATNPKSSLSVLDNLLFTPCDGGFTVTGSDNESWASVFLPATLSDGEGMTFCVNARTITEVARSIPSSLDITIEMDEVPSQLVIDYFSGRYSIPVSEVADYPSAISPQDDAVSFVLPSSFLSEGFGKAVAFTANDDLRPIFGGVLIDIFPKTDKKDGSVVFVGTDGHRIYRGSKDADISVDSRTQIIVPARAVAFLRMFIPQDGMVQMAFDKRIVRIVVPKDGGDVASLSFSCRCIDGRYPNYNAVVPKEQAYSVVVERKALSDAVKRVGIMANVSSMLLAVEFKEGKQAILLDSKDMDFNRGGHESVATEQHNVTGNPRIGVNAQKLSGCLAAIGSDRVSMSFDDPSRPIVLRPMLDDGKTIDTHELALVMPMLLS